MDETTKTAVTLENSSNNTKPQEPTKIEAKEIKEITAEEAQKELVEVNLMKEEFEEFSYDLPSFDGLSEDFDVEKAYEKDSSFLLREIRKIIVEKLSAYLQLFETFMNPSSPPMFVFSALRSLDQNDKDMIKKMYKDLSKYQLISVKLDTIYKEENEATFILQAFNEWQEMKPKVYTLIEKLEKAEEEESARHNGGYFN